MFSIDFHFQNVHFAVVVRNLLRFSSMYQYCRRQIHNIYNSVMMRVAQHGNDSAVNGNRSEVFQYGKLYHDLDNACLNIGFGAHQWLLFRISMGWPREKKGQMKPKQESTIDKTR